MELLQLKNVEYRTCSGVYRPAEDTFLLAQCVSGIGDVLEMGTGTGIIAIACAMKGARVTAADKSQAALECVLQNAELNGVTIETVRTDLFENIRGTFDEIVFNPPYLPTSDRIDESWQWDGGEDGFMVIRPFLKRAPEFLKPGGFIRVILSDLTDIRALMNEFNNLTFTIERNEKFDFEAIYACTVTTVN